MSFAQVNVYTLHYKAELQPRVEIRQTGTNALLAFVPSQSTQGVQESSDLPRVI